MHSLRLRHHFHRNLADWSTYGLCKQHPDVLHVPSDFEFLLFLDPELGQVLKWINVCRAVTYLFLPCQQILVTFHYESGHLEIHDAVLTLHCQVARILEDYSRYPWVMREAMSSAGLPADLHAVEGSFCIECLSQAQTSMCLVHEWEVFMFLDVGEVLLCYFSDAVASNGNSKVLGNSGYDFVLLSLVLYNWLLNVIAIFELLPPQRIPGWSYNC